MAPASSARTSRRARRRHPTGSSSRLTTCAARLRAEPAASARARRRFVHGDVRELDDLLAWARSTRSSSARPSRRCWPASTAAPDYVDRRPTSSAPTTAWSWPPRTTRSSSSCRPAASIRSPALEALRFEEAETRFELAADSRCPVPRRRHRRGFPARRRADALRRDQARGGAADRGVRRPHTGCAVINRCGVIAGPWQMGKVDQGVFTHWMLAHHFGRPLATSAIGGSGQAGARPAARRRSRSS